APRARESRADIRKRQQHDAGVEERFAAHAPGDVHKGGSNVRKGAEVRPDPLPKIGQKASEDPGKEADENRCQQYVAFWILDVLGQGGYSVEADIGQGRERGGM